MIKIMIMSQKTNLVGILQLLHLNRFAYELGKIPQTNKVTVYAEWIEIMGKYMHNERVDK